MRWRCSWFRIPRQFDVIVTNNLFGDIITDIGAALQGGLGMAASGNLHPGRTSMFEPVHGSAPPLAGKNVANPIGAILSSALLLETLGRDEDARRIERAVESAVHEHAVTRDVGGTLGHARGRRCDREEAAITPNSQNQTGSSFLNPGREN